MEKSTPTGRVKEHRGRRTNEIREDELEEQLRRLKLLAQKETQFPVPYGRIRSLAISLSNSPLIKLKPDTIRQILGCRYPQADDLINRRGGEAWWYGPAGKSGTVNKEKKILDG
jgi:hypothetical protein